MAYFLTKKEQLFLTISVVWKTKKESKEDTEFNLMFLKSVVKVAHQQNIKYRIQNLTIFDFLDIEKRNEECKCITDFL